MSAVRPNLCPQLSEDVVSKLRSAGVKTVVDLIKTDLEGLALETSLPYKVSYTAMCQKYVNFFLLFYHKIPNPTSLVLHLLLNQQVWSLSLGIWQLCTYSGAINNLPVYNSEANAAEKREAKVTDM